MKESIQRLFIILILCIILLPNNLFAASSTVTAVGEYVMGDNDTYSEAKKLALQDAKRILIEKVGTYIESKTEVKDGIVKSDEIKQYTAGIVKVEEVGDERSILANKATVVKVTVKAIVDPDALIKQVISFRNRKDVEESAKKTSAENDRLRKEIEQLNEQLRNVVDENKYRQLNAQRKEILERIDTNEKGLTLLLSGEGLYAAALTDRQKKDERKAKVKKYLREIASAYKLSATTPEVNDNGDGTANVKFTIKADAKGLNIKEFSSTGLDIYICMGFCIRCSDKEYKYIESFMASELEKLFLFIKLGGWETKEYLSTCPRCNTSYEGSIRIYNPFKKEYTIKLPLSELKSLSQLKVKIFYDSQEYGQ